MGQRAMTLGWFGQRRQAVRGSDQADGCSNGTRAPATARSSRSRQGVAPSASKMPPASSHTIPASSGRACSASQTPRRIQQTSTTRAGRGGFEPPEELFVPHPLSRRALSASQPPPRWEPSIGTVRVCRSYGWPLFCTVVGEVMRWVTYFRPGIGGGDRVGVLTDGYVDGLE